MYLISAFLPKPQVGAGLWLAVMDGDRQMKPGWRPLEISLTT
jgi:hypothetical protein